MEAQISRRTASERKFVSILSMNSHIPQSKWKIIFASFISHMVLPNLLLSHGIVLLMRLEKDVTIWNAILAPSIFCIVWTFADPFFREAAESWANKIGSRLLCVFGVLLAFFGVLLSSFVISSISYTLCFGILCGLGTSMTLSQVNYVVEDHFYTNVSIIKTSFLFGEAFGQLILPFVITVLFHLFGSSMGHLLLSSLVLQTLPAILYVKSDALPKPLSKCGDFSRTYKNFEGSDISFNSFQDIQLIEMTKKTWRCPSDGNETIEIHDNNNKDEYEQLDKEEIVVVHDLSKGFQILPKIVEESERSFSLSSDDETNDKSKEREKVENSIKRYSMISDKIDEFILKTEKENIQVASLEVNQNIETTSSRHSFQCVDDQKQTRRNWFPKLHCSCSYYRCYRIKRWFRYTWNNMYDILIPPLISSLKMWQFYPCLLLKSCTVFVPVEVALMLPVLGNKNSSGLLFDTSLFISVHALSWLSFLFSSPWLVNITKSRYKYFTISGLFMSSLGLFVLMEVENIFLMTFATFLVGSSHGIISLTSEETIKASIGAQHWPKIRDTLKRMTAILLIFFTVWLRFILKNYDVNTCFGLFASLQGASGLIFSLIPLIKILTRTPRSIPIFSQT
ncbi:uncharacterized protein LOC143911461 [Arctopsyche grandis]|uniref:uncharacterized protein LOC143911461 n=1 Tax=Arctopsyche grandis TaxID=121162 RepID=UPI00406DA3A6